MYFHVIITLTRGWSLSQQMGKVCTFYWGVSLVEPGVYFRCAADFRCLYGFCFINGPLLSPSIVHMTLETFYWHHALRHITRNSINYIPTYLNGAEYGTFDDLMLPIGEGLKAMERLCSSAHWTNRRSLLTLPEGLPMGLFSFLSLRFGLTERSIFFSSTADVFVKAVSRFWSAVYALLVYWWPFLFPPFEYSVKKNRPCRRRATS